ncbi:GNAT family N-acetyltransferase [Flagellimonas hymeniacidonis]|uniref:GNAT family N-acetyltransferase n=1 Tax=Flagellimonas hymeniacidonis TaxID=2603628 RepID=A0A5C8V0S0_9FLAO|nr:GNAT family N-acetyltransferase [Flagellimonas hymeniacidonis]TXN35220.1 GNAT family N-acetyltransferase [Flagellimonas hymeniacidonis]
MEIRSLENVKFELIIECFLNAFKGYFVEMPTAPDYYRKRWHAGKVDYGLSFGMFDDDKLIGFIINAIDQRNNKLVAHNTGTGVLPSSRGKHLVDALYDHALPLLREKGIQRCTLEVITKNIPALKVYKRIGFEVIKNYKCYNGKINNGIDSASFILKKVAFDFFDWKKIDQKQYSWDNQMETLKNGAFEFYAVFRESALESYFVIDHSNAYLGQFDVFTDAKDGWERLFTAIGQISNTIRINNVDTSRNDKINFLNHIGLKNTIDQYEMELILK